MPDAPQPPDPTPSEPPPNPFVHLRVHSQYSLEDGLASPAALVARARELGMPAIAITDWHNLFGLVKFIKAAQAAGIKPLVGADLRVAASGGDAEFSTATLLVRDRTGYLNLCRLISKSFLEGRVHGQPRVRPEWLDEAAPGLVALLDWNSDVGQALANGHFEEARRRLGGWLEMFPGRLYLELQRTGRPGERAAENGLLALAADQAVPVVATNDVRFPASGQFLAHEARVCIHQGRLLDDKHRAHEFVDQQYLKSPAEMTRLFADLPVVLENTVELAKRLNLDLRLGEYALPEFPVPGGESADRFLRHKTAEGMAARLERYGPAPGHTGDDYRERIERELEVIVNMGFSGYFLIVADFIAWARNNDVPVGPGRGSGAGSLVAWSIGITDPDPLRYDLLFERFLNPERVSMPDFDIDFCVAGRDRVIDYVAGHYGRDRVSQIITYGTLAAKAAVRDCGRVLGYNYGFVDSIAKLIPMQLDITLEKALAQEPELKERFDNEDDTRSILELAMQLEGVARNAGKHAGGVVIAPGPLTDFAPLYTDPRTGSVVTQFDKNDVEAVGLVKFDFLGLRNLTIIDWALKSVNRQREAEGAPPVVLDDMPLDDAATFELLQKAHTTAVFQLESRGMKDLLRKLVPDSFDDIVAAVALFRPGPLDAGMVDDYVERKHGRAKVEYPHPLTEPILKPTYGVILYQEQVMQIAQVVAGYTLGAADLLRRAMGKKDRAAMAEQRTIFVAGAAGKSLNESEAGYLFDLIETFAGYGFNKSHSVAYALVAYHTAWLKAHYPAEFMAAVLSADMDKTDKVANLIEDCRAMQLEIRPPDVNASHWRFEVEDGAIRYGLGAVKGVGEGAIETLMAARDRLGRFESLGGLLREIDLQRLTKKTVETLIRAGALDSVHANRSALMQALPDAWAAAERHQTDREAGQASLFGGENTETAAGAVDDELPDVSDWTARQRLRAERETLGLYLSGHPMDDLAEELAGFVTCRLGDVGDRFGNSGHPGSAPGDNGAGPRRGRRAGLPMTLAGLIVTMRRRPGKGAFVAVDDGTGRLEVAVFDRLLADCADRLVTDEIIIATGKVEPDDFNGGHRMVAEQVIGLDEARARYAHHLHLTLRGGHQPADLDQILAATLKPYRNGETPVIIDYRNGKARATLRLGQAWRVKPCSELLAAVGNVDVIERARLEYGSS
ncbi:MAG: DNA polymerase III subunit alpha [Wenzhouxiangellaceae bacterium]|nr:DNA polymerase III subunit alpha [Wenzhouxiangellaceae bacterium]